MKISGFYTDAAKRYAEQHNEENWENARSYKYKLKGMIEGFRMAKQTAWSSASYHTNRTLENGLDELLYDLEMINKQGCERKFEKS